MLLDIYQKSISSIHDKVFDFNVIKLEPTEWIPQNIYFTRQESNYPGLYNYDITPYVREIVENMSPSSDIEMQGIMKNNQSGITHGVIVPYICYIMAVNPCSMMFLSGTDELMKKTVRTKLDPVIQNSGIGKFVKSQDSRRRNRRTGDTDFEKQFAGGTLIMGSYKPSNLRMASVKVILGDEFDDAPYSDNKEGSTRVLLENRTTAFPDTKKICYLSTPTVKGASNIEEVYDLGDKRHWHWECPHCKNYIDILWRVKRNDGSCGGIKFEVDDEGSLIEGSVYYECQECTGKIYEREKMKLNLSGIWVPTAKPYRAKYRSYQINAIYCFDKWDDLAASFLLAKPIGRPADLDKLKAFMNTKLAQTWEERGVELKVSDLQQNQSPMYKPGIVPDLLAVEEGNGRICLITLSCDLGGIMKKGDEDVRLDWEIVAHTSNGATYRIDHGSIGTFKRTRKKSKKEKDNDFNRKIYTYNFNQPNSVWPELEELISMQMQGQSGNYFQVGMTVIDTGNFTKLANDFIRGHKNPFVVGIKGYAEDEYRKLSKDTPIIKKSLEQNKLYILQVNQLKDILSANIRLVKGIDGYQPPGFMNYPSSENNKFQHKGYFEHYEGEHRVEQKKGEQIVGFAWKKKHSDVENHFWDTAVYTVAAKEIFIDIWRKSNSKYKNLTWELWSQIVESKFK